uniref:Receptor-like serine/threonine-protein kinase n=1 Tax=Populus trichocarpa TaxID=3694 RepID=A0A2K1R9K1_POPTR|eukprot:XP_006377796.2 G-type lectin S-receptor-like serine/threonine-protein kinase At4g27290 [Populus trichocarpa]
MGALSVLFACSFLFSILINSATSNIIYPSQSIRDGATLLSTGGKFELGFFSPGNSTKRFLGIWYKKSPRTVIWVANREVPLSNTLGALNISSKGILFLYSSTNDIVWSSNSSRTAEDSVADLLETGNLVVREGNDSNPDNILWQSFDHPGDTMILGIKLGSNFVTKIDKFLSSWKSAEDPARGEYSFVIDTHGYPQLLLKRGNITLFRAGPWNGIKFIANPSPIPISDEFVFNSKEVYFQFGNQTSVLSRLTLSPLGLPQSFTWNDRTNDWVITDVGQFDQCENYAFCGPNTRCEMSRSPICACLDGFIPKSLADWNFSDWSDGCIRRTPLECSDKVGFLKYTGMKFPDTSSSWYDKSISLKECQGLCLKNCSCTAYANLDIRQGGSGCLIWFGDLIDTRRSTGDGQDLFVRMNASELGVPTKKTTFSKKLAGIVSSAIVAGIGMLMLGIIISMRKWNLRKKNHCEEREEDMELPIFDMSTIAHATDAFSNSNKLGEGGFGPVYKGILIGGQQIAVKRLSKSSGQGLDEFKNEVMLIAKLQHRSLVKLLGCCIHEDERMLIYEYMPNNSLDSFIFDQTGRKLLDWSQRINIIGGIARGLLYLHQDSRLRIIHRDIKASNILLDDELNPKISDFGLARMFGGDQTEAKTSRIVGTYGYMSPEYASNGYFSVKSDAFSFGVLVLEIVSGKKNRGFRHLDPNLNLLGHAWMLWIKGTPFELIDEFLIESCNLSEVLRCIHVALLCVQQRPEDRPNMSAVVLILGSEIPLPQPKQPGFFMGENPHEHSTSSNRHVTYSGEEVSLISLDPR